MIALTIPFAQGIRFSGAGRDFFATSSAERLTLSLQLKQTPCRDRYVPPLNLREWARAFKRESHAVYLAARDPRVPWYAKALAICVTAYALSPIDLIPDFIPVFGYLDDLIVVPLGVWLAVTMIPADVMTEYRAIAAMAQNRPLSKVGAVAILTMWIILAAAITWLTLAYWRAR
jgi:uncharacterized membrane protein YkvA (DUF1232 family)